MSSPVPEFRPCEWCERRDLCGEDEACHFEQYGSGYGPGNPDYEFDRWRQERDDYSDADPRSFK